MAETQRPSDGPALDPRSSAGLSAAAGGTDASALGQWDNLPPHLSEALREAMQGLSEAYLDVMHPLSPQLQALWDVTDQIEAWLLAQEQEVSDSRE